MTPKPQANKTIAKMIKGKRHAIKMYSFDIWGSSASSNIQKIEKLRVEISNLKEYGREYPTRWQKIKKIGKR